MDVCSQKKKGKKKERFVESTVRRLFSSDLSRVVLFVFALDCIQLSFQFFHLECKVFVHPEQFWNVSKLEVLGI